MQRIENPQPLILTRSLIEFIMIEAGNVANLIVA